MGMKVWTGQGRLLLPFLVSLSLFTLSPDRSFDRSRAPVPLVKIRAQFSRTQIQKDKNIHFSTVKLLTKFVIITYASGSVHKKFGV